MPWYITGVVLALVVWAQVASRRNAERGEGGAVLEAVEWLSYDFRVRLGARLNDAQKIATNLATVFIDDKALRLLNDGSYGQYLAPATNDASAALLRPAPPLPRFIHGQFVRELARQGAEAAAFDIFFTELQERNPLYEVADPERGKISSDEFFAAQITQASNVILAVEGALLPNDLFRTNLLALASAASNPDKGVLRRVKPFEELPEWHPLILARMKPLGLDLWRARTNQPGKIVIPREKALDDMNPEPFEVPLNANGTLKLTAEGDLDLADDPADEGPMTERPFQRLRIWNLGLRMAAKALGLDLSQPEIVPGKKIVLRGANGIVRQIPIDSAGYFQIDWSLRLEDIARGGTPVYYGHPSELLIFDKARSEGGTVESSPFQGRLVLIGSTATGNNMTDMGATPLDRNTPLVTKHLNIANSILQNRFVHRTSPLAEAGLILALGFVSALLTWRVRVLVASVGIVGLVLSYAAFTGWMYLDYRWWVPLVVPAAGGLLLPHFALVTYRVIFEQREQRRVRGIFSRIVSPDVVQELLSAEKLALGGARRKITVFFADVRGFTEFTDSSQEAGLEYVRKNNLGPEAMQAYFDKIAAEQLATVNLYLATIADTIKEHKGTLDKYMGDCVMAFWGAPTPNEQHAASCVRASIDAQRSLYELNQQRFAENDRRKQENTARAETGEPPLPLLPLLSLGSGINTGYATVGLMGSDATILNYTVFGREVNLASRLEGASGRGRILISESTYVELQRDDAGLAALCVPQAPITPKGFRQPIKIYEVTWKSAAAPAPAAGITGGASSLGVAPSAPPNAPPNAA